MIPERDTPSEILAELASAAISHIDAGALSAFESAMRDMTDYNRLLLSLYATTTEEGTPDSFARLEDGWRPLHWEWFSNYGRIAERAVTRLMDDSQFFATVSYTPLRLLSSRDEPDAPDVLASILGLGSLVIYRLERWLSGRLELRPEDNGLDFGRTLKGFERSAYEDALITYVGAWESILHYSATALRQDRREGATPEDRWDDLRADWPFFHKHLLNTAEAFGIAIWNRDQLGSERFRDMLLRWRSSAMPFQRGHFYIRRAELIDADLTQFEWHDAMERLKDHLPTVRFDHVQPEEVFQLVLANAHQHAELLAASVALNWSLRGKAGRFSVRSAASLMRGELLEPDESSGEDSPRRSATRLFWHLVAMELTRSSREEGSYDRALDSIANSIDRMSERKVTSGRTFTPTTLHDRRDLISAFALLLMAEIKDANVAEIVRSLREFAEDDSRLPNGDRTLRDISDFLKRLTNAADHFSNNSLAFVEEFDRNLGEMPRETLKRLCDDAVEMLEVLRTDRIKAAEVDSARLFAVAQAIDRRLSGADGYSGVFSGFEIRRVVEDLPKEDWSVTGVNSAEFVKPEMTDHSGAYTETIARTLSHGLGGTLVWRRFFDLTFRRRQISAAPDTERFWQRITDLATTVGPVPVLLLPNEATSAFADRFLWGRRDGEPHTLEITGRDGERGHGHIATVNGVDVFPLTNDDPQEGFLFSRTALERVDYSPLGLDRLIPAVELLRDEENPWQGILKATIARRVVWSDSWRLRLAFRRIKQTPTS